MRPRLEFDPSHLPPDQGMLETDGEEIVVNRTDRGLDDYDNIFELRPEDTKNKDVLNLGSGYNRHFEHKLNNREHRRPNMIISLDPLAEHNEFKDRVVIGRSEDQPFLDESFDLVLAYVSVPQYLKTPESVTAAFEEAIRIMRPSGKAEFFPLAHSVPGSGKDEENVAHGTISPDKVVYFPGDDGFFEPIFDDIEQNHPEIAIRIKEIPVEDPDVEGKMLTYYKLILYKMPKELMELL